MIPKSNVFPAIVCAFFLTPNFYPPLDKGKNSGLKIKMGP